MIERQQKRVVVVEAEKYDNGFPPETVPEFLKWLDEKVGEIPKEFLSEAEIVLETTNSWDMAYAKIRISYLRPETDEEMEARFEYANKSAARARINELRQLAELKAKYEGEQQ